MRERSRAFVTSLSSAEEHHQVHTLVLRSHHLRPLVMAQPICFKALWLALDRADLASRHRHKSSRARRACQDICRVEHHQA
jgi:hypothetical protein